MEKIENMIDELVNEIVHKYPGGTDIYIKASPCDGYINVCVERWESNQDVPVEARKRRDLLDVCRISGEWSADRSESQNSYYLRHKCLLKEG